MSKVEEFIDDHELSGGFMCTSHVKSLVELVREECNQWISIHDMTPPHCSDCLVFIDNGKTKYQGVYGFVPEVWDRLGVTHWMPLPKPPSK